MAGPGLIGAIMRRPRLWGESVRAAVAMIPRGWWRSTPRLPLPEPGYMAWRRATAYGSADVAMDPKDVIMFLEWRRRYRRATPRSGVADG